jgi:hypothetical protein
VEGGQWGVIHRLLTVKSSFFTSLSQFRHYTATSTGQHSGMEPKVLIGQKPVDIAALGSCIRRAATARQECVLEKLKHEKQFDS